MGEKHIQRQKLVFKDSNGYSVENVNAYVSDWLNEHPSGKVYVGTDSQVRGGFTKYSTVICMWEVGYGVWELHSTDILDRPKDRFTRLWNEVTRSVEVAEKLREVAKVTVHLDFNSNPKFASYALYDAGIGLVKSLGFEAAGKPDSWAASCGANRRCQ